MKTWLSLVVVAAVLIGIAWGQKVLAQSNSQGAPNWNQFCESFDGPRVDFGRVTGRVKQLGSEGWELAAMSNTGYNSGTTLFVCFKRPGR